MTKAELIGKVATKTQTSMRQSAEFVNAVFDAIRETVGRDGEDVAIKDFGRFSLVVRAARAARNPHTGEEMLIPTHKAVVFRAAANWRKGC